MSADTRTSLDRPDVKMEGDGILRTIVSIAAEYLLENEEPLEPIENDETQPDNNDTDNNRRNEVAEARPDAAKEAKPDATAHDADDLRSDSELDDRDQEKSHSQRVEGTAVREEAADQPDTESRADSRSDNEADDESSSPDSAEPELEEDRQEKRAG
jgi:hypothetical protein